MLSSKNCWTCLDTEPKPESPWWTSSYDEEDQLTLKVGGGRKDWVAYKAHTARMLRIRWKKMDLFSLEELCAETVWKTIAWAVNEGEVPVLKALRYVIGWRTTAWWRNMSAWGMKWDPLNITCWKHKWRFHNRGVTCQWPDGQVREKVGYRGGERVLPTKQKRFLNWYWPPICHHYRSEKKRAAFFSRKKERKPLKENRTGYSERQQDDRQLD